MRPIGLIVDSSSPNRLGLYIKEILLIEGYNAFDVIDLSIRDLCAGMLAEYPMIIISNTMHAVCDVSIFENYVADGGSLIAIKPPVEWDYIFGIERCEGPFYIKTVDGYLHTNRSTYMTADIVPDVIRFIGEADLYCPKTADCLNYISGAPERPVVYPGLAINRFAKGRSAIFTYDLASCIVFLHQGNPGYSSLGLNPDADRNGKFTPEDLFKGQFDYKLRLVPQADVHQDFMVKAISLLTKDSFPVPRLWHFPYAAPSIAFIDGDSDGMTEEDYDMTLDIVTRYKGKYTCQIMNEQQDVMARNKVSTLRDKGHDFGPHFFCGVKPTLTEMIAEINRSIMLFKEKYGFQPLANRGHSVIWAGWTEMAEALYMAGLRIDTSFCAGSGIGEGFVNGSALPVKFMDLSGHIAGIFEQSTQTCDDGFFSQKTLLKPKTFEEAVACSMDIIKTCIKYHGVYHPYFHPIHVGKRGIGTAGWFAEALGYLNDLGMPFVNGSEWALFNEARNMVDFTCCKWLPEKGRFLMEVTGGLPVDGLTIMLPPSINEFEICSVHIDNSPVDYRVVNELEGRSWAIFSVNIRKNGILSVEAGYE